MSKIIYTDRQINEIESNKYVEKCSKKQIRFTNEFKIELLKLSDKGIFYREIFKKLGFPEYVINSKVPERSFTRMKNIKKNKGLIGLIGAKKGRPKKEKLDISKMDLSQQNDYLKAKV